MDESINKPVIGVLGGTGAQGGALALRWANAGYPIVIGSRTAGKADAAREHMQSLLPIAQISSADNVDTAEQAEIVVLCVPYASQLETVVSVRPVLSGKILVDATVPLVPPKVARVQLPSGGSAVAHVQEILGETVRVVSAFQNVAAHVLADLYATVDCDVLVCGNEVEARETVIKLASDIGLRAIHAGPIVNSAAAEALTSILISINARYKIPGAGIRITGLDKTDP